MKDLRQVLRLLHQVPRTHVIQIESLDVVGQLVYPRRLRRSQLARAAELRDHGKQPAMLVGVVIGEWRESLSEPLALPLANVSDLTFVTIFGQQAQELIVQSMGPLIDIRQDDLCCLVDLADQELRDL